MHKKSNCCFIYYYLFTFQPSINCILFITKYNDCYMFGKDNSTGQPRMNKWKMSKMIAVRSWELFKQNKYFALFPLMSFVLGLLVIIATAAALFLIMFQGDFEIFKEWMQNGTGESEPASLTFLLGMLAVGILSAFIQFLFQAGLVAAIYKELGGEDSNFKEGMSIAWSSAWHILLWALISITVGAILRALREKTGLLGNILFGLTEVAWSLVSVFVLPIIVVKKIDVRSAITESTNLFKKTWGENLILRGSLGLVMGIVILSVIAVYAVVLASLASIGNVPVIVGAVGVAIFVVTLMLLGLLSQTLSSVFMVTLYRYAATGEAPAGFDKALLDGAIGKK